MHLESCPLCGIAFPDASHSDHRGSWTLRCPGCAAYEITDEAIAELASDSRRRGRRQELLARVLDAGRRGESVVIRVSDVLQL